MMKLTELGNQESLVIEKCNSANAMDKIENEIIDLGCHADHMFFQPSRNMLDILRKAYLNEPPKGDTENEESPLQFEQGLWWLKDCIFVPLAIQPIIFANVP